MCGHSPAKIGREVFVRPADFPGNKQRKHGETLVGKSLIQPLFDGSLDIVGDVHGEIGGLLSLLEVLGYDRGGNHPDGRRLVFVGDLTDRGPASPEVVRLVSGLVAAARAQGVLALW